MPEPIDTNPKSVLGQAKPGMFAIPPVALLHLGRGMEDGEKKYGLMNWREHDVSTSVYYNAAMRHLMAYWDGEDEADDSGIHHLGHTMACCAILLDAHAQGCLNDNRPATPGMFSKLVKEMTKALDVQEDTAEDIARAMVFESGFDPQEAEHKPEEAIFEDAMAALESYCKADVDPGPNVVVVQYHKPKKASDPLSEAELVDIVKGFTGTTRPRLLPKKPKEMVEEWLGWHGYAHLRDIVAPVDRQHLVDAIANWSAVGHGAYQDVYAKPDIGPDALVSLIGDFVRESPGRLNLWTDMQTATGYRGLTFTQAERTAIAFYLDTWATGVMVTLEQMDDQLTRMIGGEQ